MQYSQHCYAITGLGVEPPWLVNAGFIVGNHSTLIIDTSANYFGAKTIYGYAKCASSKNRLTALNTEPHFDHIGGNSFFADQGVDVYAHPAITRSQDEFSAGIKELNDTIPNSVRKDLDEANTFFYKTRLTNPNKALTDGQIFDLGGIEAHIIATPGHTPSNMTVFIPSDATVYCGDTIVTGYLPNLEAGGPAEWDIWLDSLDKIEKLEVSIIVPGHGDVIEGKENIEMAINRMRAILQQAIVDQQPPTR